MYLLEEYPPTPVFERSGDNVGKGNVLINVNMKSEEPEPEPNPKDPDSPYEDLHGGEEDDNKDGPYVPPEKDPSSKKLLG